MRSRTFSKSNAANAMSAPPIRSSPDGVSPGPRPINFTSSAQSAGDGTRSLSAFVMMRSRAAVPAAAVARSGVSFAGSCAHPEAASPSSAESTRQNSSTAQRPSRKPARVQPGDSSGFQMDALSNVANGLLSITRIEPFTAAATPTVGQQSGRRLHKTCSGPEPRCGRPTQIHWPPSTA